MDVKAAFLNGIIDEEIYMKLPEGLSQDENYTKRKIFKIEKALYGLRISPKQWNDRFTQAVLCINLKNSDLEPFFFTWREKDKFLIRLLYVDDILMTSNDSGKLNEVQSKINVDFEMSTIGNPKEFIGITIRRDRERGIIDLCQEKNIDKILKRFGVAESHPHRTPMITSQVSN